MQILIAHHFVDNFDTLAANRKKSLSIVTERRQEISRRGREIFKHSKHILRIVAVTLIHRSPSQLLGTCALFAAPIASSVAAPSSSSCWTVCFHLLQLSSVTVCHCRSSPWLQSQKPSSGIPFFGRLLRSGRVGGSVIILIWKRGREWDSLLIFSWRRLLTLCNVVCHCWRF